jgi:hypothetical protein
MKIEQLNSLTEDELAMLWGCINVVKPTILQNVELETQLFTSINHKKLMNRLLDSKKLLKEEHHAIFDGLVNKLRV